MTQVEKLRVQPQKIEKKKCLSDQTKVWSWNIRVKPMKTEREQMTAEVRPTEYSPKAGRVYPAAYRTKFWNEICATTEVPLYTEISI